MSGEVHLGSGEKISALVASLAVLAERVPITEFAVIGGLAVLAHLAGSHRVTDDVDTVVAQHGDEPSPVDVVVSELGTAGAILGTKVDSIAVGDTPAAELSASELPTDDADRMFVLAHRWALDGAGELVLLASALGGTTVRARCRFASPASLVAMKLQAAPRRRASRAHKAGGDYFDIFRLVSHPDLTRSIAQALSRAPHDLGTWSAGQIRARLIEQADATAAIIARSGVAGLTAPEPADLTRAANLMLDRYEQP